MFQGKQRGEARLDGEASSTTGGLVRNQGKWAAGKYSAWPRKRQEFADIREPRAPCHAEGGVGHHVTLHVVQSSLDIRRHTPPPQHPISRRSRNLCPAIHPTMS